MERYYATKESNDKAVYMTLDPESVAKGTLLLGITPDAGSTANENISSLKYIYSNYISSPELAGYVSDKTGCDIDDTRLIGVSVSGSSNSENQNEPAVFTVRVLYKELFRY